MEPPGRVVILNGTSSSGKTSIATLFRDRCAATGHLWFLTGIDDVLAKLPLDWIDLGLTNGRGPHSRDGLWFEAHGDGGRVLRVGPLCRRLLRTYYVTVAAAAHAGLDVLVDECMVDATAWQDWQAALVGLEPTWVAVRCDPIVAMERERRRGDRAIGLVAAQADIVHLYPPYSLQIDTTSTTPGECADLLADHLAPDSASD